MCSLAPLVHTRDEHTGFVGVLASTFIDFPFFRTYLYGGGGGLDDALVQEIRIDMEAVMVTKNTSWMQRFAPEDVKKANEIPDMYENLDYPPKFYNELMTITRREIRSYHAEVRV